MNVTGATRKASGDVMTTSIPIQSIFNTFQPQSEPKHRGRARATARAVAVVRARARAEARISQENSPPTFLG